MTPKEKAEDLVNQFRMVLMEYNDHVNELERLPRHEVAFTLR